MILFSHLSLSPLANSHLTADIYHLISAAPQPALILLGGDHGIFKG